MLPNSAFAALTPTQITIVVVIGLVLIAIALWVLFSWRPRHRATQAETAAQMFREDHLGEWAHKRLSTWTTDERHAALRYYTRVGFQARSGAIRVDTVPDNHHATIVALAAQETDGGTAKTKWSEVEWLGRNLAKRRDDLSIKWTPTAKATPDSMVNNTAPTTAEIVTAGQVSLATGTQTETADEPASDVADDGDPSQSSDNDAADFEISELEDSGQGATEGKSDAPTLATALNLASSEGDSAADDVSALDQNTSADLVAAAGPDSAKDSAEVVESHGSDPTDAAVEEPDIAGATATPSSFDGLTSSDKIEAETETAGAASLADALARAEVAPENDASSTSFDTPSSSDDSENKMSAKTLEPDSSSGPTADPEETSETEVPETPDPEVEATISESTRSETTAGQPPDDHQTTDRANVPTWILDARAALDSLDSDATSAMAEHEAVSLDARETNGNENNIELAALTAHDELEADELEADELEADELEADEVVLADLDDIEVAYLAASTATAATEADAELRIRMQRLRRRAKRQMRKSADDRAIAVRRAEQGRKKKASEFTKRAAAHEAKATKFKARRRKLRDIRQGTYKG